MTGEFRLVITTCGDRAAADRLAGALVERRLAACVNVLPGATSTYRWMGNIEREDEVLLLIKSTRERLMAIEETIRELSAYEVPEIVVADISGGSADYLAWVAESVRSGT